MPDPEVTCQGGVWHFHFNAQAVLCTISRLRQHRDHVTGEIVLSNNTAESGRHLHQATFNLSSTTAKNTLAKALSAQRSDVNWNELLEQVRVKVLSDFRAGEPLVWVGNLDISPRPQYRLEPLCPEGRLSAIYGAGGDGKSTIAVLAGLCVQLGVSVGPLKPVQGNVLYMDYEDDWETINALIWGFRLGMNWPAPKNFIYRQCSQPLVDEIQEVNQIIAEHQISFGILDSVGMACVGEDTSASFDNVAIRMLRGLRSTKIPWLLIDHRPHKEDKQFGSEYKRNEVRSQWSIRKSQEPDSDTMSVGLYHKKVNQGRLHSPLALNFTFKGEAIRNLDFAITVNSGRIADTPELVEELTHWKQVELALAKGALSLSTIVEKTSLPNSKIRTLLSNAKKEGRVYQPVRGMWGLPLRIAGLAPDTQDILDPES